MTSKQYHPHGNTLRTTTISCINSFLRRSCQKLGVTAGQSSFPNMAKPLWRLGLNNTKADIPISLSKEVLNQLTSLTSLCLEVLLITTWLQTHSSWEQATTIYKQLRDPNQGNLGSYDSEGISSAPAPVAHSGSSSSNFHAGLKKI